ncbi:MAG: M28 family peptidase [Nitrospirae bacterium]|uniref:M28 family peptidase n=1 Tax=Candidatus Magnetobacterium casense TaxID=1455061 RepID=UPI0005909082|nr:M28 family peptidase [Candidatus Magnetobacterium casensis]MBF0338288.1 M28 family peptidase [Nitrospirota bacterium]
MIYSKGEIAGNVKEIVYFLAREIGSRSYRNMFALEATVRYISQRLSDYGYSVSYQTYKYRGNVYRNIIAELRGKESPETVVIIGAHYDTVYSTPGADDNASGIAGLLEVARVVATSGFSKTVRFVAFAFEEFPAFISDQMASYVYARSLRERNENVELMICLEMIGYFSDKADSQRFPLPFFKWFYPREGNFIVVVGDTKARRFVSRIKHAFRKGSELAVESITAPRWIPGITFSDHKSFWKCGYDAVMITDTAFYRNPNYHRRSDTPDTLCYGSMAEVVSGLVCAIGAVAGGE